jgi:hypothetical protein
VNFDFFIAIPPSPSPTLNWNFPAQGAPGIGRQVTQEDIATFLDIEPKTLRKHFRRELDRGMVEATAKVAQSLFQMATTGNNVAAAIFWMEVRAGWREKQEIRLGPTELDQVSDEELMRVIQHRPRRDRRG